jgi:tetratricopeptide (TPR) repeat protein
MQRLPESIGPYRVLEVLGRGAAGAVFRALDGRDGRLVALKCVETPSEASLPAIRREIQALSRLRHPGIVRILDSGAHQGLPWMVLELVEGPSLRRLLAQGLQAPLQWLLTLFHRLCGALAYLHGEGLVHRDLKPENVLVTGSRQQAAGRREAQETAPSPACCLLPPASPVIVDFGLAVLFAGGASSRDRLAVDAGASGTLLYMAPEQLRRDPLDARADLYALGCMMYEALCGRPPFLGGAWEVRRGHLVLAPEPPSRLRAEVPRALEQLLLRLLAKEPRERLGYAGDVAAVLLELGAEPPEPISTPAAASYLYRPGFVGREEALVRLEAFLSPLRSGRGGLVLLAGESGIGKTRLAVELSRRAERQGLEALAGECQPAGGPLHALQRPLQTIADRGRSLAPEEAARLLGGPARVLEPYEPALGSMPGLEAVPRPPEIPPEAALQRLHTALAEALAGFSGGAPMLLVLDDLQSADELTLGWLEHLLHTGFRPAGRPLPLLVLATCRTGEAGGGHVLETLRKAGAERLDLGRLAEPAVGSMVRDMLALPAPPALFVRFLARHSEGNPFFVAEVLRAAVAESLLYRDAEGFWQVAEPGPAEATEAVYEALPLPASIREAVLRRVEGLGPDARRLLEAASVLGRQCDETLLAALEPELGAARRLEAVQELLVREVIEAPEPDLLRFAHDRIREVLYEALPSSQRVRLHRAAAEAIEARQGERPEAALGRHWERAEVPEKARACYLAAARLARRRYAHHEAERLYRASLAVSEAPSAERVEARAELAQDVLDNLGRFQEALAEGELAVQEARQLGDRRLEGRSLSTWGTLLWSRKGPQAAAPPLHEALEASRTCGDRALEGRILNTLATVHVFQGEVALGRAQYEQALALHRDAGDRRFEGMVLANLGGLCHAMGRLEEARTFFSQSLSIAREVGNRLSEGITLGDRAAVDQDQGRIEEARSGLEQAIETLHAIGMAPFEAMYLGHLAGVVADLGRPEEALALYERALALHRELPDKRGQSGTLLGRARLTRRMGHAEEAARCLDEAEALLQEIRDRLYLTALLLERGHEALTQGRSARALLEQARAEVSALGAGPQSRLTQDAARLEAAEADFEAGRPLLHGERIEELPEGLRRWLEHRGMRDEG